MNPVSFCAFGLLNWMVMSRVVGVESNLEWSFFDESLRLLINIVYELMKRLLNKISYKKKQ